MVLNDYVDRERDTKDVEGRLTRHWRLFGTRPLAAGEIPARHALALFLILILALLALGLIATLPYPHSLFVAAIMGYSYAVEVFYQVKKRDQNVPIAQVVGRTDFALFPVAGYLAAGMPDLVDVENDQARGMRTVPLLYGMRAGVLWIAGFTALHGVAALLFAGVLGPTARAGLLVGFAMLVVANFVILRDQTPEAAMRVLPLFHLAMVVYAAGMILGAVW